MSKNNMNYFKLIFNASVLIDGSNFTKVIDGLNFDQEGLNNVIAF